MTPVTATRATADFVAGLTLDSIPADVIRKTKTNLLYNLVTALASEGRTSVLDGLAEPSSSGARLLGSGQRVSTQWAATVNSAMLAVRAQDDTYVPSLTHIGGMVSAGTIALAEERNLSGADLLVGLVAGYEVTGVLGSKAVQSSMRGFRPASLYAPLGVAAGCARLVSRDPVVVMSAVALGASFSGGTSQTWRAGTQEWLYQSSVATRDGLLAAQLAEAGVIGAPDALEGADGFYASFLGDATAGHDLVDLLGERWITLDVTYKSWPVCTFNQSPVTTLIDLASARGVSADDVAHLVVHLSPAEADYPGIDNRGPFADSAGALMSTAFCLAVALTERRIRLSDTERYDSPEILALIDRIELVRDGDLPPLSSRITIQTQEGDTYTARSSSDPAAHNWPHEVVLEHVRSLRNETRLSEARLEELIALVHDLERSTTRELVDACVL